MNESMPLSGRVKRGVAKAMLGLAVACGVYFAAEDMVNPESHNRAVAACAAELGTVAMHDVALPKNCEPFARVIAERNGTAGRIEPDGTVATTYNTLPSRNKFMATETITAQDAALKHRALKFVCFIAGVGAVSAANHLSEQNRRVGELVKS